MRHESEKTPATWKAESDVLKEMPDKMHQVHEYLKLYRFKTEEALDTLEFNVVWALKIHRRWNLALSVLVGILCIVVATLTVRFYNVSKKMPAAKESAGAAAPDNAKAATENLAAIPKAEVQNNGQTKPATSGQANLLAPEKAKKIIKLRSEYVLTYFRRATFDRLAAKYIHPEKGVHFYPTGLKADGNAFTAKSFKNVMFNPVKYDWGNITADGTPFKANFVKYYKTYIYDEDFLTASSLRFNEISFPGEFELSAAAIAHRFPGCIFTEYRKGASSLVLVFEQIAGPGVWYLVAVIHNA